jgi:hypothetical protein
LLLRLFGGDRIRVDLGRLIFDLRLDFRQNHFSVSSAVSSTSRSPRRSISAVSATATTRRPKGCSDSGDRPEPTDVRLEMTNWLKRMSHHDDRVIFSTQ